MIGNLQTKEKQEIDQKVVDLGGMHKYDLTPDVTHLIVGDYDTPKYRHVARERTDILAMDATWIDALSDLWKNDEPIDFLALERLHQLKPLETRGSIPPTHDAAPGRQSLLVCLTGFGHDRDAIAERIVLYGGKHTDDLTRRCTHLIVSKPEGKKFTAARSWNIRTVTLNWLDATIARGMILDESKYDPLLPPEEQGVGAWIKRDVRRPSLGKRSRTSAGTAEEGKRKLRKTASMRLTSERSNLLGDILGRSDSREYSFAKPATDTETQQTPKQAPLAPPRPKSIFSDCAFYIHGFNEQRTAVLAQTIQGIDGVIASTIPEVANTKDASYRFLVVPQTSQPESHPRAPSNQVHFITEFYIEKCLQNKKFFPPDDEDPLGRPFPVFPIAGFSYLRVCSAAFTGIELSQVARAIKQLGASFEEQFRRSTSVLICKSLGAMRKDKLKAAMAWGVPVVSANWLWECIATGYNVPFDAFIYPEIRSHLRNRPSSPEETLTTKPRLDQHRPVQRVHSESAAKTSWQRSQEQQSKPDPTAFQSEEQRTAKRPVAQDPTISADFTTPNTHPATAVFDPPLTELSAASLNKSPSSPKPARSKSEPAKNDDEDPPLTKDNVATGGEGGDESEQAEASRCKAAKAAERQALSSKLTTLLSASTSAASAEMEEPTARPRKRQILGRAVSNVSAGSSAASAPATAALEDEGNKTPPRTQIGYADPDATDHKAALIDRMMGGTGDLGKTNKAAKGAIVGARSLRKR
ncbi:S-M checkpoint control protein-like protein [Emericellopsis cladophorae]|uniref:S-M checkpoint control protein-like protein n=1 Tax=Emericellopsis cladophorae TaxID=2686198 RepID=A0A9P9XZD1_9HYPO|nr:S-M checkpoint control protein-like protein [Emericellopsis cladophorae]KAI6780104.1 S-M checkpoint control protein-like protein [Emericellopsis cladophorae]